MGQAISKLKKKKPEEEDEEELEEREFQKYLRKAKGNPLKLDKGTVKHITEPVLKLIFENNQKEFEKEISKNKNRHSKIDYEWEISLAFWLAVHLKRLEMVQYLVDTNIELKRQVYFAFNHRSVHLIPSEGDNSSQVDEDRSTYLIYLLSHKNLNRLR